jgi:hypothetical protein
MQSQKEFQQIVEECPAGAVNRRHHKFSREGWIAGEKPSGEIKLN